MLQITHSQKSHVSTSCPQSRRCQTLAQLGATSTALSCFFIVFLWFWFVTEKRKREILARVASQGTKQVMSCLEVY
jgi:hypothetical protein